MVFDHTKHGIRDRLQQNRKFKVGNISGSSTATPLSSFLVSQRFDQSSDGRLHVSRSFNAEFFNARENNLQAQRPENSIWYLQTEHYIPEEYMHATVSGDNESNKFMEIYGQSSIFTSTTEKRG